ncbi:MAG TPA: RNA polymerase sigma factor [Gemmataceae bacterium]
MADLLRLASKPADQQQFARVVGEIVVRYRNLVYAQALRVCRKDRSLADDVFQDTFLRLFTWLKRRQGSPPLQSLTRLLRVFARRAAIDLLRKQRPQVQVPENAELQDIETALYARELLEMLADRPREVLRLTYLEGLSSQEIATRLGLTEGNVRVLRLRALQQIRLRQELDDLADSLDPV